MKQEMRKGIMMAILAAVLYAMSSPFSKILLNEMPPTLMAGFLYLGAGIGMSLIAVSRKARQVETTEIHLSKAEMPYIVAMILLDIAAPICMLIGLNATTAANVSLLNNFEIVATALIALVIFSERISKRLWMGIFFVTLSSVILSFEDVTSLEFSYGSLFVLLAAVFRGLENNCTRKLSLCDPLEIVLLKGIFSGTGSIVIGLVIGERLMNLWSVIAVMAVGIVSYGLSIYFYVHAQRLLGAARTSAYYAVSPFIAAFLSILIFGQIPEVTYFIALILMAIGAWYSSHYGIEE